MVPFDLCAIIYAKHQIEHLKQQIDEATDSKVKCRLQRQLKELQVLQLWQLSQTENNEGVQPVYYI